MRIPALLLVAGLGAAALAGCGSSGSESSSSSAAPLGGPWATSDCSAIAPPQTGAGLPEGSVVEGEVATTADVQTAPIVSILEGGYHLDKLGICVEAYLMGLLEKERNLDV